ncbi:Aryl-alcohol dehydrogenase [NADP(+)] [Grifola frondosa]|uniref:Aryl-alcohol dehydrogenase [NADP(+)] n=1 Tax=Grifola frondosa TaxID=5627 RepID=A0A1C7LW11_GRIFR|nr:Aryl-alcohol dehydrogenase [NADP(+)] [Grifola frondosa]
MSKFWVPPPPPATKLGRYRQLSPLAGVHVSPMALGASHIGDQWVAVGMGAQNKEGSFKLLDAYYEGGGNFIDTANCYQDETSEMFIGEWMEARGIRDQLVIATKYTADWKRTATDIKQKAHYVGNNLKSLHLSVEASLRKLRTSYIDILYIHWWDYTTSVEELMNGLHHLVAAGKVFYLGISDTPAWVVSKANTYARLAGKTPFVIYQGSWSILERDFERDIIPMAREEGLALAPFHVLASGKIRTDEEEQRRRETGEKGRMIFSDNWSAQRMNVSGNRIRNAEDPVCVPDCRCAQGRAAAGEYRSTGYLASPEQVKYLESVLPFNLGFPHSIIGDGSTYSQMYTTVAAFDKWPMQQAIRPA